MSSNSGKEGEIRNFEWVLMRALDREERGTAGLCARWKVPESTIRSWQTRDAKPKSSPDFDRLVLEIVPRMNDAELLDVLAALAGARARIGMGPAPDQASARDALDKAREVTAILERVIEGREYAENAE